MNQNEKVLRHLNDYGSITSLEALNGYGIMRLGARIYDLRSEGYPIVSEMTRSRNRFGEDVHFTTYRLQRPI